MPVSKKRKKKRRSTPPPSQKANAAPKKKLSKQKIILYIISIVMILSLAASFVIGSSGSTPLHSGNTNVQSEAIDGSNLLSDPPASNAAGAQNEDVEQNSVAPDTNLDEETGN